MSDIAKAAGVSRATVANCFQDNHKVSQETRSRVLEIARQLGYHRDAQVSRFMQFVRRSRELDEMPTIAVLTQFRDESEWRSNHSFKVFLEIVSRRAHDLGYRTEAFFLHAPGMTPGRMRLALRTRRIEAIIVAPTAFHNRPIDFNFEGFAAAMCASPTHQFSLPRAEPDEFRNALIAMEHVIRGGYNRVGLVLPSNFGQRTGHRVEAAYYHACRDAKLPILNVFHSDDYYLERLVPWLESERPDAVVASYGLPLFRWLAARYRIPREFGFASLEKTVAGMGFSGIDVRSELVDAGCVDLVVSRLHGSHRGEDPDAPVLAFVGRWVDGGSVREAP